MYSNPPSYVSMFVYLSVLIHSVLGANDKRDCYGKGLPLKPRHSLYHHIYSCLCKSKKKKYALYFYELCDLFCFVVRPLGMYSINFIETRYLETFAYVWAQHNITFNALLTLQAEDRLKNVKQQYLGLFYHLYFAFLVWKQTSAAFKWDELICISLAQLQMEYLCCWVRNGALLHDKRYRAQGR